MGQSRTRGASKMKTILLVAAFLTMALAAPKGKILEPRVERSARMLMRMPGLMRQARQVEDEDEGFSGFYGPSRDSQASGSAAYGAPHAAAPAGPDHIDYGAYTGGYGAFGWYTDHPVLLGPGHH